MSGVETSCYSCFAIWANNIQTAFAVLLLQEIMKRKVLKNKGQLQTISTDKCSNSGCQKNCSKTDQRASMPANFFVDPNRSHSCLISKWVLIKSFWVLRKKKQKRSSFFFPERKKIRNDLMCHSPLQSRTHIVLVGVSTASLPISNSSFLILFRRVSLCSSFIVRFEELLNPAFVIKAIVKFRREIDKRATT